MNKIIYQKKKRTIPFKRAISLILWLSLCLNINAQSPYTEVNSAPKNIIIMIGDGMGFNHLQAANYYFYGTQDSCIFKTHNFKSLAQATYPAQLKRGEHTVWSSGYSPQTHLTDPSKLAQGSTCSGAAATALATGVKTYNGAIGIGINNDTLINVVEAAQAAGKATGIVTSVPVSHATPAGFVAHNASRNNYEDIALQMLLKSNLDVLMGAGNPDYNDNAEAEQMNPRFVGGQSIWEQLKTIPAPHIIKKNGHSYNLSDANNKPKPWTLIQDSIAFAALLTNPTPVRVLGIPKVYSTLQQGRKIKDTPTMPFETPLNPGLPSLELMSLGAINVLSNNEKGFFLMIEGGAIDWAAHDNQSDRLIEEMFDFLNTVTSVIEWVETHSSWDETLLIVTSDHECGFLWGRGGNSTHNTIKNNGKGNVPDMKWYSGDHSNILVPLFSKGNGTNILELFADEYDPIHGRFVQNTEIAQTIFLLWGKPGK